MTQRKTHLLHTHRTHLVACLDALLEGLAKDEPADEATRERVAGAVRVDNLRIAERGDREDTRVIERIAAHRRRGLGPVSDHNRARAARVRLGQRRDGARDGGKVGLVGEARCGCPRLGFGLVPDNNIAVGQDLLQLRGEKLGDEGCGEVEDESLSKTR